MAESEELMYLTAYTSRMSQTTRGTMPEERHSLPVPVILLWMLRGLFHRRLRGTLLTVHYPNGSQCLGPRFSLGWSLEEVPRVPPPYLIETN